MKQRFSSLDVKVIAHELSNNLVSLRLANIYDLSSRIFLLKFAKPDVRQQIVVDSGFRCHLTSFSRTTAAAPSPFVARLRKYLRTRRVTSVTQVGTDRILEFQFSDGQYRLFLEFYAGGNIVLTDKELNIITLLRIVSEGPDQEELRVGLKYSLDNRQNYRGVPNLTHERVKDAVQNAVDKAVDDPAVQKKRSRKQQGDSIRKALSASLNEFPPVLLDHAMHLSDFSAQISPQLVLEDTPTFDRLMHTLNVAKEITRDITSSQASKGFIIAKVSKNSVKDVNSAGITEPQNLVYEDFHPFRPKQFEENPENYILEIDGFNKTVDEFFSSIESQKLESRLSEREENAKKKLDTARQEHEKRLGGLQQAQELNVRKAEAIEASLEKVQEATAAINGVIAQGMDWVEIARLIEMEQAKQNPVAGMIKLPLKLYENTATLLLPEATFDVEDDYEGNETGSDVSSSEGDGPRKLTTSESLDNRLAIDIDLALSPWSNARQYYDQKKTAAVKEQKTIQSSAKALKSTERKINADLNKGLKQEKQVLRPVRKQLWFEKFIYFISSEGYLVLAGRDAQQNEILYKRYLKKGDVYVHADLHGAASIIIKNKAGMLQSPIPPSTLSQAGTLAVATSTAWDSKAVMSAWWVGADQVSKTAPTGEYLTTGGFTIKGQKTFLPPAQLLLGFGLMFQISEESKARHMKNRVVEKAIDESMASKFQERAGTHKENKDAVNEPEDSAHTSKEAQEGPMTDDPTDDIDEEPREGSQGLGENGSESEISSREDDPADDASGASYNTNEQQGNEKTDGAGPVIKSFQNNGSIDHGRSNPLLPQSGDIHESQRGSDIESTEENLSEDESQGEQPRSKGETQGFEAPQANRSSSVSDNGVASVRHLSAKERRLFRQDRHPQPNAVHHQAEADTSLPSRKDESPNVSERIHQTAPTPKPSGKPQNLGVRGKHGKRSKIKNKYADQDEDDRLLALQVLGSAAGQQKVADDTQANTDKELELAAQKERRRKQHALAAQKGKEAEEIRKVNMQEGIETLDDEEMESHGDLDAFVGTTLPGDEILDALVVCGPWDAIGSRCKWKAKLQPGTTKKGKAIREILSAWMTIVTDNDKRRRPPIVGDEAAGAEGRTSKREGELIKNLREQEIQGVVPVSKCRVIVGGGEGRNKGKGGGGAGKGKRGGKGSKKQR